MWNLISVMQLDQWIKERRPVFLMDIRDRDSYEADHIPCAVWIDGEALLADPEIYLKDKEKKTIVLICYHGALSIRAARILAGFGYTAYSVSGGMEAWNAFL